MSFKMSWLARVSVCVAVILSPVAAVPALADAQHQVAYETRTVRTDSGSHQISTRDLQCLSEALYFEARGEGVQGQKAVAEVIMNRVDHPRFPKTVCGVVFQGSDRSTGCQFTFTCDGSLARLPRPDDWDRARAIARAALSGTVEKSVGLATHYHTRWVAPYWR